MNFSKLKVVALLLAGGEGKRANSHNTPKQLLKIEDRHIINYCLDIYQRLDIVDTIVLVVNDDFRQTFEKIAKEGSCSKIEKFVGGGKIRQESVFNGLSAINSADLVVIQNAVSIFTPPELILTCIEKARTHKAVSAFCPENYSSFTYEGALMKEPVERKTLGHVRDPQVFDFNLLLSLHKRAVAKNVNFTNDVILARTFGHEVYLVESPAKNFKITTDVDLRIAHEMVKEIYRAENINERN
jgi:2-C-methyl-D-erythritol 4-phosphate cytidylyltransferase